MEAEAVQWQPALVVLASGLVLGALVAWWLRRSRVASGPPAPEAPPLELRDLDGRVAALLVQLRELEEAAVKRTPEQLARERYALELEAARALQARDALASRLATPASKPASAPPAAASTRGFVWGAATSAVVAVLLFLVSQAASNRPEGGGVTGGGMGNAPRSSAQAPPDNAPEPSPGSETPDAHTAQLRAALAKNPEDLDTRLQLARHLLGQHDLMGVWNETQYVLQRQPNHPRALTYQSLVRLAMGQGEMAVEMLKKAIAAEPDLLEAYENLAFVYTSLGRAKEAEAVAAEVERRSPPDGERLRQALVQLAESREKQAATPASVSAHQGVPAPGTTAEGEAAESAAEAAPAPGPAVAQAPAVSAPAGTGAVFGWIEADAGVAARVSPSSVIFLTVRPAGVAQGPPVAVKRLSTGGFPIQFEISVADSMMGQPLPDRMRIDARADSDGDPMTRPASDPAGYADGVALGKTGVRITLK
jgi:tetratricopeptide (TPR) repeat protein